MKRRRTTTNSLVFGMLLGGFAATGCANADAEGSSGLDPGSGGIGTIKLPPADPASVDPGAQGMALVSAGGTCASPRYRMVFTLGQPSLSQGLHASSEYSMRNGIGIATGSAK